MSFVKFGCNRELFKIKTIKSLISRVAASVIKFVFNTINMIKKIKIESTTFKLFLNFKIYNLFEKKII